MSAPVLTITLNPAIDQTITLDRLIPRTVHRAKAVRMNAGGKGINVASCLADWGMMATVTGLLGTDNAGPFDELFRSKRISDSFIRLPGETRTNIKIADLSSGDTTDINLSGLSASPSDLEQVRQWVRGLVSPGSIALLAGSLPDGLPPDSYNTLLKDLNAAGVRTVLDSSGPALASALNGDRHSLPWCVKPNRAELEELTGSGLPGTSDLLTAARDLIRAGVGVVVVSLGSSGALFVTADQAIRGYLPAVNPPSTVGAGDAMVAGLIAAFSTNASLDQVARLSMGFAVGKLGQFGPNLPEPLAVRALAARVDLSDL